MVEVAAWGPGNGSPPGRLAAPDRRARAVSALLAILVQLVFVLVWVKETHGGAPRRRAGARGIVEMQLWTMAGGAPAGTIHPNARPNARNAAPKKTPAPAPVEQPWAPPPSLLQPPEPPRPVEPVQPPMSAREIEEFNRQWAQLQGDMKQRVLDDARHHGLKQGPGESDQPLQKFAQADPTPSAADQASAAARPRPSDDDSMFAGELCVTRAGGEDAPALALPCIGDGYTTDYGWESRVHAPRRGEPMPTTVDPVGRVMVRQHEFGAATLAALAQAQAELYKIQVTVRLVYVPDLKQPIQLLAREDRARAMSVQAFRSEEDLAAYLNEWAANVRRWTAYRGPPAQSP